MENLLTPQSHAQHSALNIHEVLERVRSVVPLADPPKDCASAGTTTPVSALIGDKERLIQVMLDIVRNAAGTGDARQGEIILRTCIARQVTLSQAAPSSGRDGADNWS